MKQIIITVLNVWDNRLYILFKKLKSKKYI